MPKKKQEEPIVKDDPSRIIQTPMEDVMHNSMIPYAEHVILERALPRVEDGLKPVQRRILYTMMELGTTPDKPHRKCARIVGDCLGKYHPHGDSSVYDALVRMAQPFSMRGVMVDGHGNFGSIDGDGAAAMRYTEARMTPLALLMLRDIDKDTVPFRLNFDDSLQEPDMLPARFPNLLVNGSGGIAVGLATNIPPHNMNEAVNAVIAQIQDPDITLDALMKIIPGPDFPTGGVLVDNEQIRLGYETGRSKLTLRARVHVEDGSAGRKLLVVTEVPYQVNKAATLEKILKLTEEKKTQLGCIYDIRDESDRAGMRAVIELRKDADPDKVLRYLYKYSDLQVTFGVNMVAIADGKPVQMGLKTMIGYFIKHQKNVITRRTQFDLEKARTRAHILQGLMVAVDNLDEVIRLIRSSKNPKEAKEKLMAAFELDEVQSQAILDMRLQRLTNLEILALRKEYEELLRQIAKFEGILASEKKLMNVIKKELEEIAGEFADPRRTTIVRDEETDDVVLEEKPVPMEATVVFTGGGMLKRISTPQYRKNPLPSQKEDFREAPMYIFDTDTSASLLFFTNIGNCYQQSVAALGEIKSRDRGQSLSGVLPGFEDDEKPRYIYCGVPGTLSSAADFIFVTSSGTVKRSNAADYDVRSKRFAAVSLRTGDEVAAVFPAMTADDILIVTEHGMSIRIPLDGIPVQGRTSVGVKGITLEEGDKVIFAGQISRKDEIVIFTDTGYGKRLLAIDFEQQSRGGKGVKAIYFNKNNSNGRKIAGCCLITEDDADCVIQITQVKSPATVLQRDDILLQSKTGRGTPYIVALFGDDVSGLRLLRQKQI